MYFSKTTIHHLIVLVALFDFSSATHQLHKRQIGNLLSGVDTKTSETTLTTTGTTSTNSPPPSTSSSSSTSTTSSTSSISSSSSSTTTATTTSSVNTPTITSSPTTSSSSLSLAPATTSTTSTDSSILPTSITTVPRTTILVTVTTGGSVYTSASIDYSTSVLPTQSGSLSPDQASSGTSTSGPNKGTIIGICVGIGVAIIIAGLGFVAWRLWGKKKPEADEDEILVTGSSAHGEKLTGPSTGPTNNPFKSTLDQYHAHSGTNF